MVRNNYSMKKNIDVLLRKLLINEWNDNAIFL